MIALAAALTAGLLANPPFAVAYKVADGTYVGDDDNVVHLQGWMQVRFTYSAVAEGADSDTFAIQQGRVKLDGYLLRKRLGFGFQMNLPTRGPDEVRSGMATLEDFYLDYMPDPRLALQAGQFKVPFLMQDVTSSSRLQLPDRSIASGQFGLSSDIGLNVHGRLAGVTYAIFAVNGDGANSMNRNLPLLVGARLEGAFVGRYDASESDPDDTETPGLGAGVAYAANVPSGAMQVGTIPAGAWVSLATVDAGFKYRGLSIRVAAMLSHCHDGDGATNWGHHAQAGYFLVPRHLELAGRVAGVVLDADRPAQLEGAVGLNYFVLGHGLKVQVDYGRLANVRAPGLVDQRVRAQVQLVF